MSLFARLGVAAALLVLTMASFVGWLTYRSTEQVLLPSELERSQSELTTSARQLQLATEELVRDIRVLRSSPAIAGIVRAQQAGGADPLDRVSEAEWKRRLITSFGAYLDAHTDTIQARLIGNAGGGLEIVRVERARAGGDVSETPADRLQRKGNRPYFVATRTLADGQIQISPIELNREFGALVEPPLPVIRAATPIFDENGSYFGALVLNLDLGPSFARLRANAIDAEAQTFAVNAHGDYVVHPDPELEFASERGGTTDWRADFPELAEDGIDAASATGVRRGSTLISSSRVELAGGDIVTVIQQRPLSTLRAATAIRRVTLWTATIATLVAIGIALIIAGTLTRPVIRLTQAVKQFPERLPEDLPVKAPGEIGELARSFEEMARQHGEQAVALRRSMERDRLHAAIFSSSHDAIVTTDLEGRVTAWNPAAERLYGFSSEEALGRDLDELQSANDDFDEVREAIRSGRRFSPVDTQLLRRDGRPLEISLSASPVFDAAGEICGIAMTTRDIGSARRMERKVAQLFDACPNGMALVDGEGILRIVNSSLAQLFGYTTQELVGASVDLLVPRRARAHHGTLRGEYIHMPSIRPMGSGRDLFGVRKDGTEVPVEVALGPFETAEGELQVVASVVDISQRKRMAEANLKAHAARLEQSNADLREFASVVSHDLKAPVRGIGLIASWIIEDLSDRLDADTQENLQLLRSRVHRLERLIEGILVYSSAGRSELRPQELNSWALVTEVLESLAVPSKFQVRISGDWPWVYWDETQFSQVFQNLVQNAILHHDKPTGTIELRCEKRPDAIWFHVIDDGVGIPAAHRTRIFGLFETLKPKDDTQTTGIGLSIVKRMVERNQGTIRIVDGPNGGVDVSFSVPHALVRWRHAASEHTADEHQEAEPPDSEN